MGAGAGGQQPNYQGLAQALSQGGQGGMLGQALQRNGQGGKGAGPGAPYAGGQQPQANAWGGGTFTQNPQSGQWNQASQGAGSAVGNALRGAGNVPPGVMAGVGQQIAGQMAGGTAKPAPPMMDGGGMLGSAYGQGQNGIGGYEQQQQMGMGGGMGQKSFNFNPPPPPGGWAPGTPGHSSPQSMQQGQGAQGGMGQGLFAKNGGPQAPYGQQNGWTQQSPLAGGYRTPQEQVQGPNNPVMQAQRGNAAAQAANAGAQSAMDQQHSDDPWYGITTSSQNRRIHAGQQYGYAGPVGYGNKGPSGVQPTGMWPNNP